MTFAERIAASRRFYVNQWLMLWWSWMQEHGPILGLTNEIYELMPCFTQEFLEQHISKISTETLSMPQQRFWEMVSRSIHVTPAFLKKNIHLPWVWRRLTLNANIPISAIADNLGLPWDMEEIKSRYDITPEYMEKLPVTYESVLGADNPALIDHILTHPDLYDVMSASTNPKITLKYIERHIDMFLLRKNKWYLSNLARLPVVTLDFIEKYRFLIDWDMHNLSKNPNLTTDFLIKYIDWDWDWFILSTHPMITPEFVTNNPQLPFDFYMLSSNASIPIEFIIYTINMYNWDMMHVSENPNFKLEHINVFCCMHDFSDIESKFNVRYIMTTLVTSVEQVYEYSNILKIPAVSSLAYALASNPKFTPEMTSSIIDFTSYLKARVICNRNATLQYIADNIDSFTGTNPNVKYVIHNCKRDYAKFMALKIREHMAAYKIQQRWRHVICNPAYAVCRRKLERDFDTLIGNR
jgi:hypothetical protein